MLSNLNKIRAFVVLTLVCILIGATIGYATVDLRVGYYSGGYHNTEATYITTSNGGIFDATFSGLQNAFNSLNNETGTVTQQGNSNITLTDTLYIGDKTTYDGGGGTLYLQANANKTMIKNYGWDDSDPTKAESNIHIRNVVLDGNGLNQPKYYVSDNSYAMKHIMSLVWVNHSSVENVVFKNAACMGLAWWSSQDCIVSNCRFYNIGSQWIGYQDGVLDKHQMIGLCILSSFNVSISGCLLYDIYNAGICIEPGYLHGVLQKGASHVVVDSCIVDTCYVGFWLEGAVHDVIISSCITRNATRQNVYTIQPGQNAGINLHVLTRDIQIIGFSGTNIGATTGTYANLGEGIHMHGSNNSAVGCNLWNINGNGTVISGINNKLSDTYIRNTTKYGIRCNGNYNEMDDNYIEYTTLDGIKVTGNNNKIDGGSILHSGVNGIYLGAETVSNSNNNTISNVFISYPVQNGTYMYGEDNKIDGCTIEYAGYRGIYVYAVSLNTPNPVITNNKIIMPSKTGIYVTMAVASRPLNQKGEISNNQIYGASTSSGIYGIYCAVFNMSICGNDISGFYSGIMTVCPNPIVYPTHYIVNNNKITNCVGTGTSYPNYGGGIILQGKKNQAVGNHISKCSGRLLWCSSNYSVISSNLLDNASTTYGIYLGTFDGNLGANNNTILGNIVSATVGIYELANKANYNIIALNNCLGCTTPIDKNGANTNTSVCNMGTIS